MPRWIIPAGVVLIVLARAAVFLIRPQSHFDADQAIVGPMARHPSILLYNTIVARQAADAIRLSRRPCNGGMQSVPGAHRWQ
jgi:hypothetical protein